MPRKRRMPRNIQQVGERFRYDKRVRDRQGRVVRLLSTLDFLSAEDAEAALFEALKVFRETGKTPTDLISEQEAAQPDDLKQVMGRHLDWYKAHLPAEYETMRAWCQKAGPLIQDAGTAENPTFGRLAVDWVCLDLRTTCERATQQDYRSILINHVLPNLGPEMVSRVSRRHVKDLLQGKAITHSPSKVGHIKACISGPLNRAVEAELIGANPAHGLKRMQTRGEAAKSKDDIRPFTGEELQKLLRVVADRWPHHYPLLLTLARTGLRYGEAAELRWGDINWNSRRIHVARALSRGEVKSTKGGPSRWVDMSGQVLATLEELRAKRKRDTMAKGLGEVPELIFLSPDGSRLNHGNFYKRVWLKVLEAAGFDHHVLHSMRHTYATLRIAKGDDIADVSKQLGHHSVKLTLDTYFHWLPSSRGRDQVDGLDDYTSAPGQVKAS